MLVFTNEFIEKPLIISERILRQSAHFLITTGTLCKDFSCKNKICTVKNCKKRKGEEDWTLANRTLQEKISHANVVNSINDGTDFHYEYNQDNKRYIIESKNKQKILNELNTIGINEAFLFPELEYESKNILNDYFNRVT